MKNSNKGFSLLEISIALSIIGILMGFAIKGRGIIEMARVKSVISQIENYQSMIQIFVEKYGGYPGDIADAEGLLGAESGNNDGNISSIEDVERFWQHLNKSGLVTLSMNSSVPTTKLGGKLLVKDFEGSKWIVLCASNSTHEHYYGFLSKEIARNIERSMDIGDLNSGDVRAIKTSDKYYLMFRI